MSAASTTTAVPAVAARSTQPTGQAVRDWLRIDEHGLVTVFCGKVDVGQGARTSLSQIVADELSVPFATVAIVLADTDQT
ncbi:MAG TPA: molybdopterin cofactor-binding domain-containing protein, partial [Chloroflexota bacterium]